MVNDNGNRNYNNDNKRNGGARPDSLLINPIKVGIKKKKSEKYILRKIYPYFKVKEFFSFLTAKEIVRWKNMNAYTSNE